MKANCIKGFMQLFDQQRPYCLVTLSIVNGRHLSQKARIRCLFNRYHGGEFCDHERVAKALKTDIYFANPYASWERGLNENFNGLLRQYIKKGTDLRTVTDAQIKQIERALNLRPRKCLGFKQPAVVFEKMRKAA